MGTSESELKAAQEEKEVLRGDGVYTSYVVRNI